MNVKCTVNRRLLPGKVAFFSMMAAGLWIYPFMILFFKSLGLTTTECSIIYGCLPIFNGFYKLFIGSVADKFQRHREMSLAFALLGALLMNCLLLIPPVEENMPPEPDWNETLYYMCTNNGQTTVVCSVANASSLHPEIDKTELTEEEWMKIKNEEFDSFSDCSDKWGATFQVQDGCWKDRRMAENGNNSHQTNSYLCKLDCTRYPEEYLNPTKPEKEMYGKTFWMVFCVYFVGFNIYASLWVLLYGMNYAILGEKRNNFGRQRVWGTAGGLTTSIISAFALNKYGSATPEITYTPCFIGFGIWAVITGITAMFFKLPHMIRNETMGKDTFKLAKQPPIFVLFIVLFIMGFLFAGADTFLFVFLRSLGASSWVLGALLFIRYVGEIPGLYYSGRIIERIGHVKCICIVLVTYCIRYLGTSLIPNPWWEIPFSLLHSVVFSIGFTAVSVYSSLITPPSMHATLQAMVQTVHFGLGRATGIFVLGPTMDAIGYRWSFRIASIIAIVTFVFYVIIQRFLPPVQLVKHDEDAEKDGEIKEPLQDENAERKKPLEKDSKIKKPPEELGNKQNGHDP